MLVLTAQEVKAALSMKETLDALEKAYADLGSVRAVNRTRSDSWAPSGSNTYYLLKSMDGISPALGIGAVRVNSNLVTWREYAGSLVKAGTGGQYVGLVLLFSTASGQPLAIFPDEQAQALRVGATTGLAVKYLAPARVEKAAVIGSGRQAYTAIEALCCVREPQLIEVYSPNPDHRNALAARFDGSGINVKAVSSGNEAVDGASVIILATSSIRPIARKEWVAPGRFITCVKYAEIGEEVTRASDYVAVNAHEGSPSNYIPGKKPFTAHDPLAELGMSAKSDEVADPDWESYPMLAGVMSGKVSGPSKNQSVLFINNIGLGVQFAAVGSVIARRAGEMGLGRSIEIY